MLKHLFELPLKGLPGSCATKLTRWRWVPCRWSRSPRAFPRRPCFCCSAALTWRLWSCKAGLSGSWPDLCVGPEGWKTFISCFSGIRIALLHSTSGPALIAWAYWWVTD
jgi:hypothetical protein